MPDTRRSSNADGTRLQTTRRTMAVLEFLATHPGEPSIKDLSQALGLNLTTTYHLANTLETLGYLVKGRQHHLRLGSKVALLYQAFASNIRPERDFAPFLRQLAEATGETAYLANWEGDALVLQAVVESPHALRVTGLYVGLRGLLHSRASGKAVLAYLTPSELALFLASNELKAVTPNTITDKGRLRAELVEIRKRGFALDEEEFLPDVHCVGAPYFDPDGRARGAVAISAPLSRFATNKARCIDAVLEVGRSISRFIGYFGPYPRTEEAQEQPLNGTEAAKLKSSHD